MQKLFYKLGIIFFFISIQIEIKAQTNESIPAFVEIDSQKIENPFLNKKGIFYGLNPEQEITELRTEFSKKYDISDGKKKIIIGGPFHYKNKQGNWLDINLNIKTQPDLKYGYYNDENRFSSKFATIVNDGVEIEYKNTPLLFGTNTSIYTNNWLPLPTIGEKSILTKEKTITYQNIYNDIDLEYELSTEAVSHKIKFNNKSVFENIPSNEEHIYIEENIQLPANAILFDSHGIISNSRNSIGFIYVVVNSDTLFTILPSRIWDASFTGNILYPELKSDELIMTQTFVAILLNNKIKLTSKIPAKWILSKSRTYPIVFDPTIYVDNNSSTSSALGYVYPFNTCRYQRISQILIKQSDINVSGNITNVYFYQTVNNPLSTYNTNIGFKEVSGSSLTSATLETGLTNCYSYSPAQQFTYGSLPVWWNFALASSFSYSNTKSLLLEAKFNSCGQSASSCNCPPSASAGGSWGAFNGSYNGHRWAYSNSSSCSSSPPTGNTCPSTEGNSAYGNTFPYVAIIITPACTNPTSTVNDQSGTGSVTMTCSASGGSGGSYVYEWFSGTSCSGTVLGTGSSYTTTTSGNYACKVSISGSPSCSGCDYGYATIASCTNCPSYDFSISPSTSYQTHSSSHSTSECKMYRISVTNGNSYTFKTGCGNNATADYDTYLDLFDSGCSSLISDDDGCESGRSTVNWTATYTGYAYLKVKGFSTSSGSYTLAYKYTSPCSPATISAGSNSPVNIGNTLALTATTVSSATYSWTGPASFSSTSQNPSRSSMASNMAGNYCVIASVGSCQSNQSCVSVTVNAIQPVANFSSNKNNISTGSTVNFFDNSTNTPTSYNWSFNGGTPSTSTSQNPTNIKYNSPGQYKVTLTVCNTAGCSTKSINAYITVKGLAQPKDDYFTRDPHPDQPIQDPIHLGTGIYKYKHTDFTLPTVAGQLNFKRCYNSINYGVDGVLGYGWSHSYNYKVSNFADTLWQVKYPDGHSADFTPLYNGGGTSFALYGGTTDSLSKTSSGYDFITKEQNLYQFDANGKLKTITDPNNNVVVLHYSGNLLDSIRDPGGRYFYLTGNTSTGKISSIKTPSGKTCSFRYDTNNNLVTAKDANGDSIRFTYNGNHEFLSFINGLGDTVLTNVYTNHKVTGQYDAHRKLTNIYYNIPSAGYATVKYPDNTREVFFHNEFKVVTLKKDALGKTSTLTYDDNFHPDTVINEKNQKTIAEYDRFGNPVLQTLPGNRTYTSKFNRFQKPTEITNPLGNKILFDYNSTTGNILSISFPDTSVRKFNYNSNGTTKFYVDGRGDTTYYFYNTYGDLIKVGTPTGNKFYGYNADGRLDSLKDENGNLTLLYYDNNGNIKQIKDALNQSLFFTYDDDNQLITFTDKKSNSTNFSYDKKGRLITRKNALNGIDSFYYDISDRIIKWRDANGNNTHCKYDSNGRRTEISNAVSKTKFDYDDIANLTKITDANNHELNISYNGANFTKSIKDAINHSDTMSYDGVGNLKTATNYKGSAKSYNYDPLNQLSKVLDVENEVTSYRNDKNGNLKSLTDGNGHTQTFTSGKASRITTYKDAEQNTYSFTYDSIGNVRAITKPVGSITNKYDKLNRLTKQTISSGDNYDFAYDPNNNLTTAKNNAGTSSFYYDSLNRMNRYINPYNNEVKFCFNPVGSISYIVYPSGDTVKYTYDKANRLWKVKDWKNNEFIYTYDSTGKIKKLLKPTGIHCDYNYDAANRLISKITYTASNKILYGQTFTFPTDSTIEETRYGSFPAGIASDTMQYEYRQDDAVQKVSERTYTNDNNGNRTKDVYKNDTLKYTYTADQLMTSLTKEGITTTFKYDALGHRIERIKGVDKTRYVLNLNSPISLVLQTLDGNGNLRKNYIYGLGLLESIDSLGNVLFYHYDANHNTVVTTDKNDSIKATYTYLPKGSMIGKTGTLNQPFTFLGEFGVEQETDSCYYIRARYLDASTGRFLSNDPLFGDGFEPQTLNRYIYALNNPLTKYDASGLTTKDEDGGFLGQYSKENIMNLTLDALENDRKGEAILGIVGLMGYTAAEWAFLLAGGAEIRVVKSLPEIKAGAQILFPTIKGLIPTGRITAENLAEQLAMKEIRSNPGIGKVIMTKLDDPRFIGWVKMEFVKKLSDGRNVIIHYVAKYENGILKAVSDFKFK
jgi:RHS repeat-associated protein